MLLTQIAYSTSVLSNPVTHGRTLPGTGKPGQSQRGKACSWALLTLYHHVGVNSCASRCHHAELSKIKPQPSLDVDITYRQENRQGHQDYLGFPPDSVGTK